MSGERSAAGADEDSVTMAVEAALEACKGVDAKDVDGVIFASTTSPYREKQAATTVASVLGCRPDVFTLDLTDSMRAATSALRVALDAIKAGSAGAVLVCAADVRVGQPESSFEQMFGDGGAAVLLASESWAAEKGAGALGAVVHAAGGVAQESFGPWRREADRFVRSFEPKLELQEAYAKQAIAAGRSVLEEAGGGTPARAVIAAPDPRSQSGVAKALGIGAEAVQDLHFGTLGNVGTAAPLLMLVGALEEADPSSDVLVIGAGDGADAILLRTTQSLPELRVRGSLGRLSPWLASKGYLHSYEAYARNRRLVERERAAMWSSPVTYWRDLEMIHPLYGMRCRECGTVQYPIGKRCMECSASGPHERTRLQRSGVVFTFTLDHLVLGEYWNDPVPRAVVDLDGGGRLFCELTDCDPADVHIGMRVELTFRLLHEGAGFRNYYWKGRPLRAGVEESADETQKSTV